MDPKHTTTTGGIRPPEYLRTLALNRLEDLMVQAMPWSKIIATMIDEGWTDSEQTLKGWRHEVTKRWAAEEQELRPARKDLWRARLEAEYHELLKAAASTKSDFARSQFFAEATKIAKVAIVLDGLAAPIAVRHEGTLAIEAMAPHERERAIADLLAKREAARVGGN